MSQIKIDLGVVEDLNGNVNQNIYKLSNVNSSVLSLTYHVDSAITARRNIRSRLQSTSQSLRELETRLKELNSFIKNSIDRYSRTETDLSRKAQSIGDRKVTLEELFTRKSDRYTTEQLNEIWNQLSEDDRKTISKQFSENWFKQVLKDIGNDIAYAAETSWDSFGEIGNDFLNGLHTRADKALDSPYDFINWLTIGASGGIYEGAKHRADHMLDSTYDFFNWLTVGAVETVDEAFTPDKPLSKEHWLASLGVVSFLYGGAKGPLGTKVGNGLTADEISAGSTTFTQSSVPSKIDGNRGPDDIERTGDLGKIAELKKVFSSGDVAEIRNIIKENSFEHLGPKEVNNFFERIKTNAAIDNGIDRVTLQRELIKKALDSGVKTDILVAAENKFLNEKGWITWPDNDGFIPELTEGKRPIKTLEKGEVIDRYGGISGNYVSPKYPETSYEQRALPYMNNPNAYHKYEVIEPIPNVPHGNIAPAFGQLGGGIQYLLPESIEYYLKEGYIRELID